MDCVAVVGDRLESGVLREPLDVVSTKSHIFVSFDRSPSSATTFGSLACFHRDGKFVAKNDLSKDIIHKMCCQTKLLFGISSFRKDQIHVFDLADCLELRTIGKSAEWRDIACTEEWVFAMDHKSVFIYGADGKQSHVIGQHEDLVCFAVMNKLMYVVEHKSTGCMMYVIAWGTGKVEAKHKWEGLFIEKIIPYKGMLHCKVFEQDSGNHYIIEMTPDVKENRRIGFPKDYDDLTGSNEGLFLKAEFRAMVKTKDKHVVFASMG